MRRLIVTILATISIGTAGFAQAQDTTDHWTEFSVSLVEKVDGRLSPQPRATIMNYNNFKGVGFHVGEESMGPIYSQRLWAGNIWGVDLATHFHGSADLIAPRPAGSGVLHTGRMGPDFRANIGSGAAFSFAPLWQFRKGEGAQWWPQIGLVFRTN